MKTEKNIVIGLVAVLIVAAILAVVLTGTNDGRDGCNCGNLFTQADIDIGAHIGDTCEWAGAYAYIDSTGTAHYTDDDATWSVSTETGTWGEPGGNWNRNIATSGTLAYSFTITPDSPPDAIAGAAVMTNISCAHYVTLKIIVPEGYSWEIYRDITTYSSTDSDGDNEVALLITDTVGDSLGLFNHSIAITRLGVVDTGNGATTTTTTTTNGGAPAGTTGQSMTIVADPWGSSSTETGWGETYQLPLILIALMAVFGAGTFTGLFTKFRDWLSGGIIFCIGAFSGWLLTVGAKMWWDADYTLESIANLGNELGFVLRAVSAFVYAFIICLVLYVAYGYGVRGGKKT